MRLFARPLLSAAGIVAAALSLVLAAEPARAADGEAPPNVLLILADDLGFSDLGCYGGEIPTPAIDALAERGLRYSAFYNSARCCPSRASLMTGLHPHQAGIGSFATRQPSPNRGPAYLGHLNDSCVTVAEVLKKAGYSTWMVGKWHMEEPGPVQRGFDEFYGYVLDHSHDQYDKDYYIRLPENRRPELSYSDDEYYATHAFNDYAIEFLDQATRKKKQNDQPWFLYVAHSSPHFPIQAPKEDVERYVAMYERGWDALRAERLERMKALGVVPPETQLPPREIVPVDREDIANGYPGEQNPAWTDLPEDRRRDLARRMATFAAMVQNVDEGVARLVKKLEETGQLDNTLILFTSDNGACYEWGPFGFDGVSRRGETILHTGEQLEQIGQRGTHHSYGSAWANLGNTPLRLYKHFCHEGGISGPLVVHWPKQIQRHGEWVHDPTHLMDVMPTVCEATGAEYPETFRGNDVQPMEGVSLVKTFRDKPLATRPLAFEHQEARALREGRWKVAWGKRMPYEIEWELFDLENDRTEMNNLANRYPERTKELADKWVAWAKRVKVYPFFTPENAADPSPGVETPNVANRPLTIRCNVHTTEPSGVILAHGGSQHGYALHLEGGELAFSVRVDGQVSTITSKKKVPESFHVMARLKADGGMELQLDGQTVATGTAAGLIPVQPVDDLSVGSDSRSAVGKYLESHRLDATVTNIQIETGPRAK